MGISGSPLIEFDAAGNVVNSWGDPNVLDPRLHSRCFDKHNNVWIGSSPSGIIQKYSHDGSKLLLQIGKKGVVDSSDGTVKGQPLNSSAAQFFMPSSIFADPQNGEIFVSDGEGNGGNRRIAVMDQTGKFLRQWQPEGMQTVHCMTVSNDGFVYVCNRDGSKIQVYDKMGKLIKTFEFPWKPDTPPADGMLKDSGGAVVAMDFSHDANQSLLYVINQSNGVVEIVDRQTGRISSTFGRIGHFPGRIRLSLTVSRSTPRATSTLRENRGRRIQKFRIVEKSLMIRLLALCDSPGRAHDCDCADSRHLRH